MQDGVPIPDAAAALGVSTKTIRRRIKDGTLPAYEVSTAQGYAWRVVLPVPHGQVSSAVSTLPNRVDNDRLRVVVEALQRTRERVAQLEALLPVYGPRDPGPPVDLPREIVPYEDASNVEAQINAPGGFWARVVAWWEDGR